MGLLEVKHGLLQIAESLDFLHNNARLIHRAISPEVRTSYLVFFTTCKIVEIQIDQGRIHLDVTLVFCQLFYLTNKVGFILRLYQPTCHCCLHYSEKKLIRKMSKLQFYYFIYIFMFLLQVGGSRNIECNLMWMYIHAECLYYIKWCLEAWWIWFCNLNRSGLRQYG